MGFTWKKIANLLGVSTSFLRKNRRAEEIEVNYSNIVDDDLHVIVVETCFSSVTLCIQVLNPTFVANF